MGTGNLINEKGQKNRGRNIKKAFLQSEVPHGGNWILRKGIG